jgi:hypothetical protein
MLDMLDDDLWEETLSINICRWRKSLFLFRDVIAAAAAEKQSGAHERRTGCFRQERKRQVRPQDAVEGKNRRRFVGCCYFAAVEKDADETRDNKEVPSFGNLLNHSNRQYQ